MKMPLTTTKGTIAAAIMMILSGCGGSGATIVSAKTQLSLLTSGGYNGTASQIKAGSATTTTVAGNTVATISDGPRTVTVTIPGTSISAGDSFEIGPGRATAVYSEVITRDTQTYTWVGSAGHITILATTGDGKAEVSVESVQFNADVSVEGNPATGSFTLQGQIAGFPISGGGGIGGLANISFSAQSQTNADTSSFLTPVIAYAEVNNFGTLATTIGSGANLRVIEVTLSASAHVGDNVTLSGTDNPKAVASFIQGTGPTTKIWRATGGTLKVVSRSSTKAKVQFVNAEFTSFVGGEDPGTGSFKMNGTIARL